MKCSICGVGIPSTRRLCAACAYRTRFKTPEPTVVNRISAKRLDDELPEELQQVPTRAATDIPGQPEASALAALDKDGERRKQAMERARMMSDYMREMSRIWGRRS